MATDSSELTFVRCPACRSLVPAISTRCRMCGATLDSGAKAEGDEPPAQSRVRQRTMHASSEANAAAGQVREEHELAHGGGLADDVGGEAMANGNGAEEELFDPLSEYLEEQPSPASQIAPAQEPEEPAAGMAEVQAEPRQASEIDEVASFEEYLADLGIDLGEDDSGESPFPTADTAEAVEPFAAEPEPQPVEIPRPAAQAGASVRGRQEPDAEEAWALPDDEVEEVVVERGASGRRGLSFNKAAEMEPEHVEDHEPEQPPMRSRRDEPAPPRSEERPKRREERHKERREESRERPERQRREPEERVNRRRGEPERQRDEQRPAREVREDSVREQRPPAAERRDTEAVPVRRNDNRPERSEGGRLVGWLVSYSNPNGQGLELREGKFFVTRSSLKPSDLIIDHESISTPHAMVKVLASSELFIEDLMSDSGIAVKRAGSSEFQRAGDSLSVEHGDWIRFGEVEYLVCLIAHVGQR